jgi:hypothetical protein
MSILPNSHIKKYALTVVLTALFIIASAVAFNLTVDPYGMYRISDIAGFNSHKPAIYTRVRMAKAYEVRRIRPRTIILGTSRTHLGIRPSHRAWPTDGLPVYNLAFDGATTKEMYFYLRHAHSVQPLRRVLLGLDTYHLLDAPGPTRPDFDAQLLLKDHSIWSQTWVSLADAKLLVSYDTILESIATISAQKQPRPEWFARDGQRLGEVFFHQPQEHFQTLGPRGYFDEIDKQEVSYKLEWRIPQKATRNTKPNPDSQADPITSLGYIKNIIEYCRIHNIELVLFITPAHAHQMEIAAATGEWPTIENGKRALVQLLEDDVKKYRGSSAFPLYDFSGYSSVTSENLPPSGSRVEMSHYWESSHFKDVVGDLVINRIFNVGEVPGGFGVRLDSGTLDTALLDIHKQQKKYRTTHADDIALIQREIADYKQMHHIRD